MQGNLFVESKPSRRKSDAVRSSLKRYDRETFEERLERLRYVVQIYPDGLMMLLDQESSIVFGEAKMAFINGEFAATVMLAQAFIERRFQLIFEAEDNKKVAKATMEAKIEQLRADGDIPSFVLEKIDDIRKKRNPFVHLKPADHEYNLGRRLMAAIRSDLECSIDSMMFNDAKDALAMMYTVASRIGSTVMLRR